jgi:hypothetical protein
VINTVKCELAQIIKDKLYATQDRVLFGKPRNEKEAVKLTLGLKIVDTRTSGFGLSASNILAFGGALSPSLGFAATEATTVETQFVSVFPKDLRGDPDVMCKTRDRMWNGIGLKTMVLGLVEQVNKAAAGEPYIRSDALKYTVTFGVTRETKLGADFAFAPVKLTASEQQKREDVQTISFEAPLSASVEYLR